MSSKRTVLALACIAVAGLLITVAGAPSIHPSASAAGVHCKQIHAYIETAFTSPNTTEGVITGDGWLKGATNYTVSAMIPGPEDNTFSYSGRLTITTKNHGTLTMEDVGVFEFLPNGPFAEYDNVVEGTGRYAGASGLLFIHGTVTPAGNGFTGDVSGELCLVNP